ncbi:hypothetical protein CEXT_620271 [Caerostris extrusa]|uniref:Uncharacterized protein n=1 Tax=Caerostris extrusa TaxID=172846 RepID=A0AAV4WWM0_CAEEX|nr:hypothetical protein CEXT_620271 [Caerostris extrusa]
MCSAKDRRDGRLEEKDPKIDRRKWDERKTEWGGRRMKVSSSKMMRESALIQWENDQGAVLIQWEARSGVLWVSGVISSRDACDVSQCYRRNLLLPIEWERVSCFLIKLE